MDVKGRLLSHKGENDHPLTELKLFYHHGLEVFDDVRSR